MIINNDTEASVDYNIGGPAFPGGGGEVETYTSLDAFRYTVTSTGAEATVTFNRNNRTTSTALQTGANDALVTLTQDFVIRVSDPTLA